MSKAKPKTGSRFVGLQALSLSLELENKMGQVCCGGANEKRKVGALDNTLSNYDNSAEKNNLLNNNNNNQNSPHSWHQGSGLDANNGSGGGGLDDESRRRQQMEFENAEAKRKQAIREEQLRLEGIVTTAGREMVATSRRDGYYDPGYAAATAADLRNNYSLVECGADFYLWNSNNQVVHPNLLPQTAIKSDEDVMKELSKNSMDDNLLDLLKTNETDQESNNCTNIERIISLLDIFGDLFVSPQYNIAEKKKFLDVGQIVESLQ